MIDTDLVTRKMMLIVRDLSALEEISGKDRSLYLASRTDQLACERYLELIIGRMIDVNYHLLVEAGQAPPRDYYESFIELGRSEVLDREFAVKIASCAGLRNRLVHEYNEIDQGKLYDALQSALRDVPVYVRRIRDYLDRA